jgi:cell division protein FtsL
MATAPVIIPDPKKRPRRSVMRVAGRSRYPDVYFEKAIDNSHIVREPDTAQRGKCHRIMALCSGAFVIVFGIALLHFECVRYGYEISQLKTQSAELKESNQKLLLQQALLADPQRIDQLARQDLGLMSAEPRQMIRLSGSSAQPPPTGASIMARNYETVAPAQRGSPREP